MVPPGQCKIVHLLVLFQKSSFALSVDWYYSASSKVQYGSTNSPRAF
jgi:hypothetical protein